MNKNVIGLATFTAKTDKSTDLRNALHGLVELTRLEAGCLSYTLNQSITNPNVFTILERFTNQEAFDLHNNMPYIVHFKEHLLKDLVEIELVSITLYTEIF
jgi:quinol monooxygenase YgiN